MRILLVDDDPDIVHVARLALEKLGGHEVDCARSAAAALEIARERRPDALVVDVLLPDESGPDLLARLRREAGLAGVPAIFLTGKADERTDELESAGAVGVIAKPFDPLGLAAEVDRLLASATEP